MSIFIKSLSGIIHKDWDAFINIDTILILRKIEENVLKSEFTPKKEDVLRFLTTPLSQVKVVIVGQDPYPQLNVATGRAFEVGTLENWDQPYRNVSLKNIIRLIFKTYNNEIMLYKDIVNISKSEFNISSPDRLFKSWENQGVLLINTSFTCKINESNSHAKLWQPFTTNLLRYISTFNPDIYWILWGSHAQKAVSKLGIKNKLCTNHPMMCVKNKQSDFLYGDINPLYLTRNIIDWRGIQ